MSVLLVPYQRTRIISRASASALIERLKAVTTPTAPWFRYPSERYIFIGRIRGLHFRVIPVIRGTNTYLPLVTGTIAEHADGSEIEITQTIHPVAVIILLIFFGAIGMLSKGDPSGLIFGTAAFIVFHVGMYFAGFLPEVRRVEQRLSELAG